MGREMIQNCRTRRSKCSYLFCAIRTRLPFCKEAKSEREGWGWSFKLKKHLRVAALLPYGHGRDAVCNMHVSSHVHTHVETHTHNLRSSRIPNDEDRPIHNI